MRDTWCHNFDGKLLELAWPLLPSAQAPSQTVSSKRLSGQLTSSLLSSSLTM